MIFHPEEQELTLFRHTKRKYVSVKPNEHGRLALSELQLEMGLFDGWCRFWYQGELLPLPADLLRRAEEADQRAEQEKQRADAAERELELLRAQLKQMRGRSKER